MGTTKKKLRKMKIFAVTLLAAAQAGTTCMYMCPMYLEEVCGSDGITYGNQCQLEREISCGNAGITKVNDGPCECHVACPMILNPVCGSDGVTYGNECALQAAITCNEISPATTVVKEGQC